MSQTVDLLLGFEGDFWRARASQVVMGNSVVFHSRIIRQRLNNWDKLSDKIYHSTNGRFFKFWSNIPYNEFFDISCYFRVFFNRSGVNLLRSARCGQAWSFKNLVETWIRNIVVMEFVIWDVSLSSFTFRAFIFIFRFLRVGINKRGPVQILLYSSDTCFIFLSLKCTREYLGNLLSLKRIINYRIIPLIRRRIWIIN